MMMMMMMMMITMTMETMMTMMMMMMMMNKNKCLRSSIFFINTSSLVYLFYLLRSVYYLSPYYVI